MPKKTEKKPAAAKYEWRKTEKAFYLPKEKGPVRIDVPEMKFFAVEGAGSPDSEEFQAVVGLLYTLSYTIRMMPKSGWTPPDYQEYTVFPLEGVWRMDTDAWKGGALDKTKLKYKLMIRQPWFVTPDVAGRAMESARKKSLPTCSNAPRSRCSPTVRPFRCCTWGRTIRSRRRSRP